jgi:hypothetical protein
MTANATSSSPGRTWFQALGDKTQPVEPVSGAWSSPTPSGKASGCGSLDHRSRIRTVCRRSRRPRKPRRKAYACQPVSGGAFDRFPKLTLILRHMGETWPFQLWPFSRFIRQEL